MTFPTMVNTKSGTPVEAPPEAILDEDGFPILDETLGYIEED